MDIINHIKSKYRSTDVLSLVIFFTLATNFDGSSCKAPYDTVTDDVPQLQRIDVLHKPSQIRYDITMHNTGFGFVTC